MKLNHPCGENIISQNSFYSGTFATFVPISLGGGGAQLEIPPSLCCGHAPELHLCAEALCGLQRLGLGGGLNKRNVALHGSAPCPAPRFPCGNLSRRLQNWELFYLPPANPRLMLSLEGKSKEKLAEISSPQHRAEGPTSRV
ncbi:hypothetical protein KIL84_014136 [Mauremys mutica]|uniref:Uncharacterized protein n=1 Tax=Mauremys mutica TaxID=74926 RepID=A0A9D3XQT2_9SAUR|nr:hypothetical protein KIL84_014136 [Mauremys mutica]